MGRKIHELCPMCGGPILEGVELRTSAHAEFLEKRRAYMRGYMRKVRAKKLFLKAMENELKKAAQP